MDGLGKLSPFFCVLCRDRVHVHLIVKQGNNGESLSQPDRPKSKRHNAKLCPLVIQERIINALASGDSKSAIARALGVSRNTVQAIEEQQWSKVEQRKARIAAQSERNATRAAERISAKLESPEDIPLNLLVPVFGVAVDKMLVLRGDASQIVKHEHLHELKQRHAELARSLIALHDSVESRPAKTVKATVVDSHTGHQAKRNAE
jgi:hypothetical protein